LYQTRGDEFMSKRLFFILLILVVALLLSCNLLTQNVPSSAGSLIIEATSPVSVKLTWEAVADATGYRIETKYGSGEFLPIGNAASDQTSFEHFVVPGTSSLTYRVTATTSSSEKSVGTGDVSMPALAPNPSVVDIQPAMPAGFGGLPTDPNAMPTIDPNNFDPNNFDPNQLLPPGLNPSDLQNLDPAALLQGLNAENEIGAEGGEVTITGPDNVAYKLSVPPGALDNAILITLSPVGGITGLPLSDGLLGAVQIFPEVEFNVPATLTIQLPASKPAPATGQIVGFTIARYSNELSLYPAATNSDSAFTMSVDWGDTFGVAAGTPQDIRSQALKIPTDAASQMAQLIVVLQSQNSASGAEAEAIIIDQLIEGLIQRLDQLEVQTPVKAQVLNDTYAVDAPLAPRRTGHGQPPQPQTQAAQQLANSIEFANQIWETTQGGLAKSAADLRTRLIAKIRDFIQKSEKACLTPDTLYAAYIIEKLGWAHDNSSPSQNFWAWLAEESGTPDPIDECTFELEITSSISSTDSSVTVVAETKTRNPILMELSYRDGGMFLSGVGAMPYGKLTERAKCGTINITDAPIIYLKIRLEPVFSGDALQDFSITRMEATQSFSGRSRAAGCGGSAGFGAVVNYWSVAFLELRRQSGGEVRNWTAENGFGAGAPNVFRRDFRPFVANLGAFGTTTENTSFILRVSSRGH
jgi:hypothetical protein